MRWADLRQSRVFTGVVVVAGLIGVGVVIGFSLDRADSWPERLRPLWWLALPTAFRVLLVRYNPDPVYDALQPIPPINAALIAMATGIVVGLTLIARGQGGSFSAIAGLATAVVFAGCVILMGWLTDWARSRRA